MNIHPSHIPIKDTIFKTPIKNEKNLLYTTLGYSEKYVPCIELFLKTLFTYTPNPEFDVLIICDDKLFQDIRFKTQNASPHIKFMRMPNAQNPMDASMQKTHIFSYPSLFEYKYVFYIDIDVLNLANINTLFTRLRYIDENEKNDVLYVLKEKDDIREHLNVFWSMKNYTPQDLVFFHQNQIYPFNAGCFAFRVTLTMKHHFTNVVHMIENAKKQKRLFFYEQAYMNVYFNKNKLVSYAFLNPTNYVIFPDLNTEYKNVILHFCGYPGNGNIKYNLMQNYMKKFHLSF